MRYKARRKKRYKESPDIARAPQHMRRAKAVQCHADGPVNTETCGGLKASANKGYPCRQAHTCKSTHVHKAHPAPRRGSRRGGKGLTNLLETNWEVKGRRVGKQGE